MTSPEPHWVGLISCGEDGAEEYRRVAHRIAELSSSWGGVANSWEAENTISAEVFGVLGSAGMFRDRWQAGWRSGLVHSVAQTDALATVSASLALAVSIHADVFLGILLAATRSSDGELREIRARALEGRLIGCFGATESGGGSDIRSSVRATAVPVSGGIAVRAEKLFVSNLGLASHAIVACQFEGESMTPVLVDLSFPGITKEPPLQTLGMSGVGTAALRVDTVVPEQYVLARGRRAVASVNMALQFERLSVSVGVLGTARRLLDFTVAFARQRYYGSTRLIDRDNTRMHLALAHSDILAGLSLLGAVVAAGRAGRSITYELAALKLYSGRAAQTCIDRCIQVLGGRGYLEAFPAAPASRHVRLARIGGGPDEVMSDIVASGLDRGSVYYERLVQAAENCAWPTIAAHEHGELDL